MTTLLCGFWSASFSVMFPKASPQLIFVLNHNLTEHLTDVRAKCDFFLIGEIRDVTDISQWHWIPSDLNVADQATKEFKKNYFGVHSNWLNGPKFFKLPEEPWPRKPEECSEENIENIFTVFEHGRDVKLPKIDIFSKWIRLIRSTTWVLHFKKVSRIPKNNRPREVKLDVDKLEEASKLWLKKSRG
ncbi:hypothetical protein JTB14_028346 [Gonioctena quinquepunctata]|nr:hypothetical protein JTB14_028346 [Gonioctena quinquepunctata]